MQCVCRSRKQAGDDQSHPPDGESPAKQRFATSQSVADPGQTSCGSIDQDKCGSDFRTVGRDSCGEPSVPRSARCYHSIDQAKSVEDRGRMGSDSSVSTPRCAQKKAPAIPPGALVSPIVVYFWISLMIVPSSAMVMDGLVP